MKINFSLIFSILSLVGVIFLGYYQLLYIPNKLQKCHDFSVNMEKARHYPVDDGTVTNQDISGYMKNMISCIAD